MHVTDHPSNPSGANATVLDTQATASPSIVARDLNSTVALPDVNVTMTVLDPMASPSLLVRDINSTIAMPDANVTVTILIPTASPSMVVRDVNTTVTTFVFPGACQTRTQLCLTLKRLRRS